jgi:hypothetical protein
MIAAFAVFGGKRGVHKSNPTHDGYAFTLGRRDRDRDPGVVDNALVFSSGFSWCLYFGSSKGGQNNGRQGRQAGASVGGNKKKGTFFSPGFAWMVKNAVWFERDEDRQRRVFETTSFSVWTLAT